MKFVMTKELCIPKTHRDVHRELVRGPTIEKSKYEQLGPNDLYRDENYALYKVKSEEFKMKGKEILNENIKALKNTKPKLGEMYTLQFGQEEEEEEDENVKSSVIKKVEKEESEIQRPSLISLEAIPENYRENGLALRKRHERYYTDTHDINNKHCYFEPWFRRYIILCRFINAARRVIYKNRMLARLEMLRELRKSRNRKEMIEEYENQYIKNEHLTYANVFAKFCE